MKNLVFLLFISTSVFSNIFAAKNNSYDISGFFIVNLNITNNSTLYNLKKADEKHKKSSFKEKIKHSSDRIFSNQIGKNTSKKLQTLAIKLDSIKQLHVKGLLKKEVLIHTEYYNQFLMELKNSMIINSEYFFLENELLKISIIDTNNKYQSTFNISLFLGFTLIVLLFLFSIKQKKTIVLNLTKQELVIKKLITDGKTNKEIANELHISLSTVKTHISNIYQKLNISNRKELLLKSKN